MILVILVTLADDKVWFDATHKVREICQEIQTSSDCGRQVLVLAHFASTLSAVETLLRKTSIQYQRFSSFDFSQLCQGSPATAGGSDTKNSPGRIWLGLARSFSAPTSVALQSTIELPVWIIVAEHHPRQSFDQGIIEAAETLGCGSDLCFHISLDDPLLKYFGGASLRLLLEKLGLQEDACISHPLVTSAIKRAQKKIEKTGQRDIETESIADWFRYNLPDKA